MKSKAKLLLRDGYKTELIINKKSRNIRVRFTQPYMYKKRISFVGKGFYETTKIIYCEKKCTTDM